MVNYKKDSTRFDGTNYSLWKTRMECHLRCIGEPFWNITCNRYIIPQNGPTTTVEIRDVEYNIRAKEGLLSALTDFEMTNVMDLKIGYEI